MRPLDPARPLGLTTPLLVAETASLALTTREVFPGKPQLVVMVASFSIHDAMIQSSLPLSKGTRLMIAHALLPLLLPLASRRLHWLSHRY